MEEILHQFRGSYPIIYMVLYIPNGCLGFLPSTVLLMFGLCGCLGVWFWGPKNTSAPGFVLPYMQRGELGTPTKTPDQLETCEFWSPTKMERKRIHPWRLTAGTCPHGGLFSDYFPKKNGWFVGSMVIFRGVGESSKISMWMGETSAIFCVLKRGWEIRCV